MKPSRGFGAAPQLIAKAPHYRLIFKRAIVVADVGPQSL
jgi:hypothetical protein